MSKSGGPYDFVYVHTDIPEGMTIRDWRAKRSTGEAAARADRRRQRAWATPAVARGSAYAGSPDPAAQPRGTRVSRQLAALAVLGAVVACVAVTLIEGGPRHLPGVALGSPVLLHAERALAMLAALVAMLSIGLQAARGRLPIELSTSGLRYEAEAADRAAAAVAELQAQYDDLLAVVDALADRLDAPQRRP